ncbi:MAG: hypothetical protein ACK56I_34565, partial [bacterium]
MQGVGFAFFTKCSFLCWGCCSLYLQAVISFAGTAVRFIYNLFLAVQGLLFALFTICSFLCFIYQFSSFLYRAFCSLYLQTVPSCAGAAARFIYELFLPVQGGCCSLYLQSVISLAGPAVLFIYKQFLPGLGLLFALLTNCSLLCRGCGLLYLQTVPSCAGAAVRFIY